MDEVDLHVVGEGARGALKKLCQTLVHEFHEQDGSKGARLSNEAQELDDARVLQVAEEPALLLETGREVGGPGVVCAEEGGVEEFGRAGQLV